MKYSSTDFLVLESCHCIIVIVPKMDYSGFCSTPQRPQKYLRYNPIKIYKIRLGVVAHACNPSYSGGRDQEDRGSRPALANSSQDPILEKTISNKGLVEWFKV
jgi:hypothetical protein